MFWSRFELSSCRQASPKIATVCRKLLQQAKISLAQIMSPWKGDQNLATQLHCLVLLFFFLKRRQPLCSCVSPPLIPLKTQIIFTRNNFQSVSVSLCYLRVLGIFSTHMYEGQFCKTKIKWVFF